MFCIQGTCENQNPVVDNTIPLKCIISNQCPSFLTFFSGILHIWPISSVWFTAFLTFMKPINQFDSHTSVHASHASPSAGHPQCCNLAFHREDKFCAFQELKVHNSTDQPTDKSWDCLVECKDLNFPRHQHHLPETKWFGFKEYQNSDGRYKSEWWRLCKLQWMGVFIGTNTFCARDCRHRLKKLNDFNFHMQSLSGVGRKATSNQCPHVAARKTFHFKKLFF